jgi:poly-gamma-glutamate synthesis protein (capsule biosynthesis protein)
MKKPTKKQRKSNRLATLLVIMLTSFAFLFFSYVMHIGIERGIYKVESIPAMQTGQQSLQIITGAVIERPPLPSAPASENPLQEKTATPQPPYYNPQSIESTSPPFTITPTPTPGGKLIFAGDILLDGSVRRTIEADGLTGVFPEISRVPFIEADIAFANLETPISLRGTPMPDKEYTYSSDPEHGKLLSDMGLDIVSLANNHTIDYGRDAFADTLEFLDGQKIAYIGAGLNMAEAMDWHTFELNGRTFAYLAASRVIPVVDWYAGKERSGMFGTYDPADLNAQITAAKAIHDYVIVYVHWGVERVPIPEAWQRSQARGYIEAGADCVIGSHPHILQGFEFIEGKLIAYSLGNFIFSDSAKDTGALTAAVSPDGALTYEFLPYEIINRRTVPIDDPDRRESLRQSLNDISYGAEINERFEIVPVP